MKNTTHNKTAILLLSGGIDSTTLLTKLSRVNCELVAREVDNKSLHPTFLSQWGGATAYNKAYAPHSLAVVRLHHIAANRLLRFRISKPLCKNLPSSF